MAAGVVSSDQVLSILRSLMHFAGLEISLHMERVITLSIWLASGHMHMYDTLQAIFYLILPIGGAVCFLK